MKKFGSIIWAILILVAIAGWVLSGEETLSRLAGEEKEKPAETVEGKKPRIARVKVGVLKAQGRNETLIVRGLTEAVARVHVRAQTNGQVIQVPAKKGAFVKKGTQLCVLEPGARNAQLAEARAALAQAELDYQASAALSSSGFTPRTREAAHKTRLDAALASISRVKLDIERATILAPFDGMIEAQPAKTGDLLQPGGICATLVKLDPILITGQVSERDIGKLKLGMKAAAALVTGESVTGHIRFIAPSANAATRTFKIELEVSNTERHLRDGVTSQIEISLKPEPAHLLSSSLLTLNDAGQVGVRIVDKNNTVRFLAVEILEDGDKGVWVGGLPSSIKLITVGQDYVRDGQKVEPVYLAAEAKP